MTYPLAPSQRPTHPVSGSGSGEHAWEDTLIHQVNELLGRSRNREALKLLREASARGPRTLGLQLLEAEACEALLPPDLDGALRAYEEAIRLSDGHWVAPSNLGLFLLRHGGARGVPRAIEVLEEARRRGPTRPEPVLNLAIAYLKAGRDTEAVVLAQQLLQGLPPEHPLVPQARSIASP